MIHYRNLDMVDAAMYAHRSFGKKKKEKVNVL